MNPISKAADVITIPARTAYAVASAGVRTTVRLLGWAAEQAVGQTVTPRPTEPAADPMEPTRTPPETVDAPAAKAPARKVPASQVPLKSDPTPSLPRGVEAIDDALGAEEPAPAASRTTAKKATTKKTTARKTAAKKSPAKKTTPRKAPSEQAAVLAPALGLSEDEVAEVVEGDTGQA